jgi:alpha-tubulin suppressor-like RCC1 family protein
MREWVAGTIGTWLLLHAGVASAQVEGTAMAFGTRHALALRANGDVLSWGDNVGCQLGRRAGNSSAVPTLVMRNAREIAAASDHSLALTVDGKVYGWGMNPDGVLGVGHSYDACEGPALVESLTDRTIVHIATGYGFSLAVTAEGDLYCAGDNAMGQCGMPRTPRLETFTRIPSPQLAGNVAEVRAGSFHTLVLTRDHHMYAFGRGRDGQLGHGQNTNGFTEIQGVGEVVSFAAGMWHSVAVNAAGSVYAWGNNGKSQLCDGTTQNRTVPARIDRLPASARVTQVAAGGHGTMMRTAQGAVYACGDNQFGPLGLTMPVVAEPTLIPGAPATTIAIGGAHAALGVDGCTVRVAGDNSHGVINGASAAASRIFAVRPNLSLCGATPPSPLPDLLRIAPRGGLAGCWAARKEEDAAASPTFAGLRQAMLAVEALFKAHTAFLAAPEPVRYRSSISAHGAGARMHLVAVPERKIDGTRVWGPGCEVIPQIDRIGGPIAQVSVFFNASAAQTFLNDAGTVPKRTGTVGGFPEYDGWVVISKHGRLPWIPRTLDDALSMEIAKREKALTEWTRTIESMKAPDAASIDKTYEFLKKTDPDAADKFRAQMAAASADATRRREATVAPATAALVEHVAAAKAHRAAFSREQLQMAAVWNDESGEARRRLDARIAERRRQASAAAGPSRGERQLALEVAGIEISSWRAEYELVNLGPGPPERAMHVKADPAFPDVAAPNRIQLVALRFFEDRDPKQTARLAWARATRETFDLSSVAALLQ